MQYRPPACGTEKTAFLQCVSGHHDSLVRAASRAALTSAADKANLKPLYGATE